MKQSLLCLLLYALALPGLCAESLSRRDRDFGMSQLHAARKLFLDALAGLSEVQWRFKPAPDRWSIAETAEHVVLSEDLLFQLVTEKVLKTPAAPEKKAEVKDKDELVLKVIADRSRKAQAPEQLRPTGKWPTREALIDEFKRRRDRTIAYVEQTEDDLRSHFLNNPVIGLMDAYQWVLMIAAHTERHTAQINEVKADPNYPKR